MGRFLKIACVKSNYTKLYDTYLERKDYGVLEAVDMRLTPTVEDEEILERVIQLIQEGAETGQEYSRRKFEERFLADLGVTQKYLRQIIETAIKSGDLVLQSPTEPKRGVSEILAVGVDIVDVDEEF